MTLPSVSRAYIGMELVEGEDLSQRLTHGPLPLPEALTIARQIAQALGPAHEQAIVHRDLKPANIKLRELCAQATLTRPHESATPR